MAKHLKLNIKNTQLAEALHLGEKKQPSSLKSKSESQQRAQKSEVQGPEQAAQRKSSKKNLETEEVPSSLEEEALSKEESPRIKARSKSVFSEPLAPKKTAPVEQEPEQKQSEPIEPVTSAKEEKEDPRPLLSAGDALRRRVFGEEVIEELNTKPTEVASAINPLLTPKPVEKVVEQTPVFKEPPAHSPTTRPASVKLGPTGRHVKDLLPPPRPPARTSPPATLRTGPSSPSQKPIGEQAKAKSKTNETTNVESVDAKRGAKTNARDFRDVKPTRRVGEQRTFDARDRQGLRTGDEEHRWRKKKTGKQIHASEDIVRPTSLKIRLPISIKDLAVEMKLKASELISKLFLQGLVVTLNDSLDNETIVQLLGQEFGCEITIDTAEERRIRISEETLKEEIQSRTPSELVLRAPVVAFMGHVDHGKTSLIDAIRKSNRAGGEAGAITQHIGAFCCETPVGPLTILDTPGHEAFSAMRARGADVTDIVVLVVAGDEGMRQQTFEALQHARDANVIIVVAINKSDKPGFNPENVYRQLSEKDLLPEVWGGQTLTVNCSAATGGGIKELLEMLALQAEILELKASQAMRARGTVLESEMHKGLGIVATVLVQNGTLHPGDALVFSQHWGRVKTMRDELGRDLLEAGPSTPISITGLSGLPEAGEEFIVVKNEREAREIAEVRQEGMRQKVLHQKKVLTLENLLQQATPADKKILNIVLRADVQGSLEALKTALNKIQSTKVGVEIISAGVGEVSETDIQLAATSKALVIGFHTGIEAHAEPFIKQWHVRVMLHDIIYHAVDAVTDVMRSLLDKIAQESDRGSIEIKAVFKSSHTGLIAGGQVVSGTIHRNNHIRVMRGGKLIAKSTISSLRRVKEDVREVSKGQECGIVLNKFSDFQMGDILEAYEVTYISQDL